MGSRNAGPLPRFDGGNSGGGRPPYDSNPSDGWRRPSASGGGYGGEESSVVMVYGVDMSKWNCQLLFNLLCLYGNVERVGFCGK